MASRRFLPDVIIKASCVFFLFFAVFPHETLCKDKELDSKKYMDAVRKFSDSVIKNGRDTYGDKHTPLFVDGLQVETLEPVIWKFNPALAWNWLHKPERRKWDKERIRAERAKIPTKTWVLCNFASQQPLLRTLDALTALTGENKYRQAAEDATRYALKNLRTPNGLLYWGGHVAWDLRQERSIADTSHIDLHELKNHQPYFSLMWRVDAPATRKLIETIWGAHVRNWSLLDYGRHAHMGFGRKTDPNPRRLPQWDHKFDEDVEVPYKIDGRLSFVNVTVPLAYSGVMLSILDNNDDVLTWTQRLIYRWQQGKDAKTGLCGGLLNNVKHDRAKMALRHIHPKINEAKLVASYNQSCRYHQLPLAQIQSGETLIKAGGKYAEVGCKFIVWALEDLKIYADRCYNSDTGDFTPMMTDGTPLQWKKAKKGYYSPTKNSLGPRDPDGCLLWGYAMAYRISKDKFYWDMVRKCGKFMGIGDIGLPNGKEQALNFDTDKLDHRIIYTLLELYRAQGDRSMLQLACRIADNMVKSQTKTGLFPRPGRKYARTGSETPLVLLHLAAVIDSKSDKMPVVPIFDSRFFACEYHGNPGQKTEIYDSVVFY